jgi:hypothetical protein
MQSGLAGIRADYVHWLLQQWQQHCVLAAELQQCASLLAGAACAVAELPSSVVTAVLAVLSTQRYCVWAAPVLFTGLFVLRIVQAALM